MPIEKWIWGIAYGEAVFLPEEEVDRWAAIRRACAAGTWGEFRTGMTELGEWGIWEDHWVERDIDPADPLDLSDRDDPYPPRAGTLMWDYLCGILEDADVGEWIDNMASVPYVRFTEQDAAVVIRAIEGAGGDCHRDDQRVAELPT